MSDSSGFTNFTTSSDGSSYDSSSGDYDSSSSSVYDTSDMSSSTTTSLQMPNVTDYSSSDVSMTDTSDSDTSGVIRLQEVRSVDSALDGTNDSPTEKDLMRLPLTQSEKETCQRFIRHKGTWCQFWNSVWYATNSLVFAIKNLLCFYIVWETVATIAFLVFGGMFFGLVDGILNVILLAQSWIFPVVLFVYVNCSELLLSFGSKRVSQMTEIIMKGKSGCLSSCLCVKDGGDKFSCWTFVVELIIDFLEYLVKKVGHFLIMFALTSLLSFINVIPIVGSVLYFCICLVMIVFYLGYHEMLMIWKRKGIRYIQSFTYCWKHLVYIMGLGFGTLLVYLIPGMNVVCYLFSTIGNVGGTRLFIHLAYRKEYVEFERSKKAEALQNEEYLEYPQIKNNSERVDTSEVASAPEFSDV